MVILKLRFSSHSILNITLLACVRTSITVEDFIKKDTILKHLKKIKDQYTNLADSTSLNLNDSKGCLYVIKEWLKKGGKTDVEIKTIVDSVKNDLFQNLKVAELEDNYFEMWHWYYKRLI